MGYTTDLIGHINIDPPLNTAEQNYLTAFASSRRYLRPGGPYEVPHNPAAELRRSVADVDTYNTIAAGQPSLWCDWMPCWDGCCLSYDGREKFYGATDWMVYLIDHFLAPHGLARETGLDWFTDFTFDHALDGIIAACRRDTRRLYLIRVECNAVREETLLPATPDYADWGPLPYEVARDEQSVRARRRRSPSR